MRAQPGKGAQLTKLNPPIVFQLHGVMKDLRYPGYNLNFLFLEITKLLKGLDIEQLSMYLLVYKHFLKCLYVHFKKLFS